MGTPYVCEGTIVRTKHGKEGRIIGIDRKHKLATIQVDKSVCSEKLENLRVVSYKGVE